jgi:hypothetical protein
VLAGVITLEMALSSANVETPVSFSRRDALRRSTVGCALAVAGGGTGAIGCSVLASAGGGVTRATSGCAFVLAVAGGGTGAAAGCASSTLAVSGVTTSGDTC